MFPTQEQQYKVLTVFISSADGLPKTPTEDFGQENHYFSLFVKTHGHTDENIKMGVILLLQETRVDTTTTTI